MRQSGKTTVVAPPSSTMAGPGSQTRTGIRCRSYTAVGWKSFRNQTAPFAARAGAVGLPRPQAQLRHRHDGGQPQVDDFDRFVPVAMSVGLLVAGVERIGQAVWVRFAGDRNG